MARNFFGIYVKSSYFQWRAAEVLSSVFSVLGILTATMDYETSYSALRTPGNCLENPNKILRYATFLLTIMSVFLLFMRHYLKVRWYNIKLIKTKNFHKRIKKVNKKKLFLEILLLCIFPYPGLIGSIRYKQSTLTEISEDYDNVAYLCYTYSEILYFLMFIRIVFVLRTLFNYTPYQDKHARSYCLMYNTKANLRFSVKSMMKTHPLIMIYFSIFFSFLLFGLFVRIFERPFAPVSGKNYDSIQNAVWSSFVTMATIGYGDIYPTTLLGRGIILICAMWGAYEFSMVVFTLNNQLDLDLNQSKALCDIKETRAAGKVICKLVEYYLAKKNRHNYANKLWEKVLRSLKKFKFNIKRVKELKRKIKYKDVVPKTCIKDLEARVKAINENIIGYIRERRSLIK